MSGVMPMPVSATRTSTLPSAGSATTVIVPPCSVYLAALASRFDITCASRSASPSTTRPFRGTCTSNVCRRCSINGLASSMPLAMTSLMAIAFAFQFHLAARNTRDIEQVVHEARQMLHLALDDRALPFCRAIAPQPHELKCGLNRRERVSQLMAEHRQELVLGAVGGFGVRLRHFGRLDGRMLLRRVASNGTQQAHVLDGGRRLSRGDIHQQPLARFGERHTEESSGDQAVLGVDRERPNEQMQRARPARDSGRASPRRDRGRVPSRGDEGPGRLRQLGRSHCAPSARRHISPCSASPCRAT